MRHERNASRPIMTFDKRLGTSFNIDVGLTFTLYRWNFTNNFKTGLAMKKIVFASLLMAAALCALSQTAQLTSTLDSMMQQYVQEKHFSGVVMVSQKGKVLYGKAFGYANKEKKVLNEPVTTSTMRPSVINPELE